MQNKFTLDEFFKLINYYHKNENEEYFSKDKTWKNIIDDQYQNSVNFLDTTIRQNAFVDKKGDYERLYSFITNWYSSFKSLLYTHRKQSDIDIIDKDELLKSFGFPFYNLLDNEPKKALCKNLINLYKIKGSPQSTIDLLKYFNVNNAIFLEYWLFKREDQLIFIPEVVFKDNNGFAINSNEFSHDFNAITDLDPHWFYTYDDIMTLYERDQTGLPSLSPYFGISFTNDLMGHRLLISKLFRLIKEQKETYISTGEISKDFYLELVDSNISYLELVLAISVSFYKLYNRNFINTTDERYYQIQEDFWNDDEILVNEFNDTFKVPIDRNERKELLNKISNQYTTLSSNWGLPENSIDDAALLYELNENLYNIIVSKINNTEESYSTLLELLQTLDFNLNQWQLVPSYFANMIYSPDSVNNKEILTKIVNFMKPYHTRMIEFSTRLLIRDLPGDAQRIDDSITKKIIQYAFLQRKDYNDIGQVYDLLNMKITLFGLSSVFNYNFNKDCDRNIFDFNKLKIILNLTGESARYHINPYSSAYDAANLLEELITVVKLNIVSQKNKYFSNGNEIFEFDSDLVSDKISLIYNQIFKDKSNYNFNKDCDRNIFDYFYNSAVLHLKGESAKYHINHFNTIYDGCRLFEKTHNIITLNNILKKGLYLNDDGLWVYKFDNGIVDDKKQLNIISEIKESFEYNINGKADNNIFDHMYFKTKQYLDPEKQDFSDNSFIKLGINIEEEIKTTDEVWVFYDSEWFLIEAKTKSYRKNQEDTLSYTDTSGIPLIKTYSVEKMNINDFIISDLNIINILQTIKEERIQNNDKHINTIFMNFKEYVDLDDSFYFLDPNIEYIQEDITDENTYLDNLFVNIYDITGNEKNYWKIEPDILKDISSSSSFGYRSLLLSFGGIDDHGSIVDDSYFFNGTTWEVSSDLLVPISHSGSSGFYCDGLCIGGNSNNLETKNDVFSFNSITWQHESNTLYDWAMGGSSGYVTDTNINGGGSFISNNFEIISKSSKYNGTTWELLSDLNIQRYIHGCSGNISDVFITCGNSGSLNSGYDIETTEHFNGITWNVLHSADSLFYSNHCSMYGFDEYINCGGIYVDSLTYFLNDVEKFNNGMWSISDDMLYTIFSHTSCGISKDGIVIGGSKESGGSCNVSSYIFETYSSWHTRCSKHEADFSWKYYIMRYSIYQYYKMLNQENTPNGLRAKKEMDIAFETYEKLIR